MIGGTALPEVQEKYNRRITRLRAVLGSDEQVYFIRHFDMSRAEAVHFRNMLMQRYLNLEFVLVVIDQKDEFKVDWQLDRIRNFYFNYYESSSIKPEIWEPIFAALGLIP